MKKIIAMILCLTMFMSAFICVPISAAESDDADEKYNNLYYKVQCLVDPIHYCYSEIIDEYWLDGNAELEDYCKKIFNVFFGGEVATYEQLEAYYEDLTKLITEDKFSVKDRVLKKYYNLIKDENNDNKVYSDELWSKIAEVRDEAFNALNNLSKEELGKVSYSLFYKLADVIDEIGNYVPVYGDADMDGSVTMKDVILVQRYLAKLEPMALAQIAVAAPRYESETPYRYDLLNIKLNMLSVMELQKNIAGLSSLIDNGRVASLHKK